MAFIWVTNETLSPYQPTVRVRQDRKIKSSQSAPFIKTDDEAFPSHAGYGESDLHPSNPYQKLEEKGSIRVNKVGEIMTASVITIHCEEPVDEVTKLFEKYSFRHIPVVNRENRLVGILSDRDLSFGSPGLFESKKVSDIMTKNVLSATKDTLVREATMVMLEENIACLPIVGSLETVIGIVTRTDILQMVVAQAPLELWA
jgi:CBS domain-containing protein